MLIRVMSMLSCCLLLSLPVQAQLALVANPYPTLIAEAGDGPARVNDIVNEAMKRAGIKVELTVTRPAFSGSGLLSGQYQGEYAALSLSEKKTGYVYSAPFLPIDLYLANRSSSVSEVTHFNHINGSRVAAHNRYVNTPSLRQIKEVSWSRNPADYDAFKKLAERRADYLLADIWLLGPFNQLLAEAGKPTLVLSARPLVKTALQLSVNNKLKDATSIIEKFEQASSAMQRDGTYNRLLKVQWLSKDINQDGTADLITSRQTNYVEGLPMGKVIALDNTKVGDDSLIVLDGKVASKKNWQQQLELVKKPESLLDPQVYAPMIRRW